MSKISDIIEEFILEQLEDMDFVNLSRNELANFFNCAPSQINYVLSTRFTEPKGYLIESHRGGGGYIKLSRINIDRNDYVQHLLSETLRGEVDYNTSLTILSNLVQIGFLTDEEAKILEFALSPKALAMPIRIENKQRANILRNVLINMLKEI
ncbi:MAG: CtsR family transcriptional regulator [Christensenellales bacterium]